MSNTANACEICGLVTYPHVCFTTPAQLETIYGVSPFVEVKVKKMFGVMPHQCGPDCAFPEFEHLAKGDNPSSEGGEMNGIEAFVKQMAVRDCEAAEFYGEHTMEPKCMDLNYNEETDAAKLELCDPCRARTLLRECNECGQALRHKWTPTCDLLIAARNRRNTPDRRTVQGND